MKHNWTVVAVLAISTVAWGQASEDELKAKLNAEAAAVKARLDVEITAMKSQLGAAQFGVAGPAVTDAPYSAEAVTETAQTLGDGNTIRRRTVARVFRDGAGRTARQEADTTGEFHTIAIFDPVAASGSRRARVAYRYSSFFGRSQQRRVRRGLGWPAFLRHSLERTDVGWHHRGSG